MKRLYKNQTGRFMIEIIIVLAMLALFTPMIYKAQLDKKEAESNTTNAAQIMQIVEGVNNYIAKNIDTLSNPNAVTIGEKNFPAVTTEYKPTVIETTNSEMVKFMPPGMNNISVNKLFNEFTIGVSRKDVDGTVVVSAMVAAVPKSSLSNARLNNIAARLGAVGGVVEEEGIVTGNNDLWEVKLANFFTAAPVIGSIIANVDYFVPNQLSGGATAGSSIDSGYIHRQGAKLDPDGKANDFTKMYVDLEMGTGPNESDVRHNFKNIDTLYAGTKAETCSTITPENEAFCLSKKFIKSMGGKTEFGATCDINDSCISINNTTTQPSTYVINPAGNTLLHDARIGMARYNKLSEIIPPMVLLQVYRGISSEYPDIPPLPPHQDSSKAVKYCPSGYVPITTVVPTGWTATSDTSVDVPILGWPFYGINIKNNSSSASYEDINITGMPGKIWGSGFSCLDMKFSNNNVLAHYLDGNMVKMRSIVNLADPIGEDRNASDLIDLDISISPSNKFFGGSEVTTCEHPNNNPGKLLLTFNNVDRCGISNISTAFACNEQLLSVAVDDFNNGQESSLLRWEFYHPPKEMKQAFGGIDLYAKVVPDSRPATDLSGSPMQTRNWKLVPSSDNVTYDVYIYCKYVASAFESFE